METDIISQLQVFIGRSGIVPQPRVTKDTIRTVEGQLGFHLPEILRQIYSTIGDGGFGPGYGIFALNKHKQNTDIFNLVEAYENFQASLKYCELDLLPGCLPLCNWGCTIMSIVDCNDRQLHMHRWESGDIGRIHYRLEGFLKQWVRFNGKMTSYGGESKQSPV